MTETSECDPWFVDAWSVRDGAIFASRRSPSGRDATSTVFICVPDLAIVPVGRQSTALAATRRQFQAGLTAPTSTDEPGREIPFTNLEQVRELVRRGYLGGGLGPNGDGPFANDDDGGDFPTAPISDEPLPDGQPPGASDGAALMRDFEQYTDRPWRNGESIAADLDRLAGNVRNDWSTGNEFSQAVTRYTEAVTLDWEQRFGLTGDAADGQLLSDWYDVQHSIDPRATMEFLYSDESLDLPVARSRRRHGHWQYGLEAPRPWSASSPSVGTIVNTAPCPAVPGHKVQLRRLNEAVLLPLADPSYWRYSHGIIDLVPAVTAALVLTSPMTPGSSLSFLNDEWDQRQHARRVATALEWLAKQLPLPDVNLPEEAEGVMSMFVSQRLAGTA